MVAFGTVVRRAMAVGVAIDAVAPVRRAVACVDVDVGNKTRLTATVDAVQLFM